MDALLPFDGGHGRLFCVAHFESFLPFESLLQRLSLPMDKAGRTPMPDTRTLLKESVRVCPALWPPDKLRLSGLSGLSGNC
jgi:hypothetical protein